MEPKKKREKKAWRETPPNMLETSRPSRGFINHIRSYLRRRTRCCFGTSARLPSSHRHPCQRRQHLLSGNVFVFFCFFFRQKKRRKNGKKRAHETTEVRGGKREGSRTYDQHHKKRRTYKYKLRGFYCFVRMPVISSIQTKSIRSF